jgi:hypothetical protein
VKVLTRTITALAATGVLLGALLAGSAPASAADLRTVYISVKPPPGSSIGPVVLDARGPVQDKSRVVIWLKENPVPSHQMWTISTAGSYNGNNLLMFRNKNSQLCLDMTLDTPAGNGSPVYEYGCNSSFDNQKWIWLRVQSGNDHGILVNYYTIGKATQLCLDATGPSYDSGTPLQVWTCNLDNSSNWNQRWNIL